MSRSMKIAAGIFAVFVLYFVGSALFRSGNDNQTNIPEGRANAVPTLEKPVPERRNNKEDVRVLVRSSAARLHPVYLSLKGRSEPDRSVLVRSETTGVVSRANAVEGGLVKLNAVLCGLDVDARQANLDEVKARFASAKLDYNATKELVEKGWKPENQEAAAKAALDAAKAAVESAEVELSKTNIRAPFAGVFEKREAEVGDFLAPGGVCGLMLDLDPLVVAVDVSEKYAGILQAGASASALLGQRAGDNVEGTVSYVASSADVATGTYRVEIALDNPNMSLPAGQSADVRIQIGEGLAHHISPALIVYSDEGRPGVRYVGPNSFVHLAMVEIVDSDQTGVWVSGLPQEANVIVQGQDYVQQGLRVEAFFEGDNS